MAAVHEKLKFMREESGLAEGQIAEYLGVSQTVISGFESDGKDLPADALEKLLDLYGYGPKVLGSEEEPAPPMRFAYRAREVNAEDLQAIAGIRRIAANSRMMTKLLEEST